MLGEEHDDIRVLEAIRLPPASGEIERQTWSAGPALLHGRRLLPGSNSLGIRNTDDGPTGGAAASLSRVLRGDTDGFAAMRAEKTDLAGRSHGWIRFASSRGSKP
jgi:hypothetical protein